MENQGEASNTRWVKVFLLIGVVVAGFALCAVMKTFLCGNFGERCSCLEQFK
jgi:hypothetical protein